MLITEKLSSSANIRPCKECFKKKGLFVVVERRCTNMLQRPVGNARQFIRCTNGVCDEHRSEGTEILGKRFQDCCPDCLREAMKKALSYGLRRT